MESRRVADPLVHSQAGQDETDLLATFGYDQRKAGLAWDPEVADWSCTPGGDTSHLGSNPGGRPIP